MKVVFCVAVLVTFLLLTNVLGDQAQLRAKFPDVLSPDGSLSEKFQAGLCDFPVSFSKYEGEDWKGTNPTDPAKPTYTMSFCNIAKEEKCAQAGGSLCEYRNGAFQENMASFRSAPKPTFAYIDPKDHSKGTQLTFENGSKCWKGIVQIERVVVLKMTCDKSKKDRTFTVHSPKTCVYEVDMPSAIACGGGSGGDSDGLSGGAIFLIIVFSALAAYFILGFIVCVAKFGKPVGLEACPNKNFWCALCPMFLAGCKFTFGKIAGCFGSKTITTSAGEYEEA